MRSLLLITLLIFTAGPSQAAIQLISKKSPEQNFLFEGDSKWMSTGITITFRNSGSMMDPPGKEGLATLAFNSLLRGTKNYSKKDFFSAVERLGGTLASSADVTEASVSLNVISENLEPAVKLLAEAILTPALKDEEIAAVKEEMLASLQQSLSSNRSIMKRVFQQALFRGTKRAFPPSGTIASVQSLTPADVRNFLTTQIKSGNFLVMAISNLPETQVKGWIEQAFTSLPEGKATELPVVKTTPIKGRVIYVVDRPGSTTTEMAFGHYGILANDKNRPAFNVGLHTFGEEMTSRLFQELREKKGWTYGAYAGFNLFDSPKRVPGGFIVYAFPRAEHTEVLTLKALQLYEDFAKKGLTAKELNFSRQSLSNSYPFTFASATSRIAGRLYEKLHGAKNYSVAEYRKALNGITQASLVAVNKNTFDPANLLIVLVGDPANTAGLLKSIPNVKEVIKVTDPMAAM